MSKGPKRCKR